jgi:hypothetical protein
MLIVKILSGMALIGSIAWYISKPDYDSAIAIITSLSASIATISHIGKKSPKSAQSQVVAEKGIGIQAGGDIEIGDINVSQGVKDAE